MSQYPGNASCQYVGTLTSVDVGSATSVVANGVLDLGAQTSPTDWTALFQQAVRDVEANSGYVGSGWAATMSGCP